jgi:integrase
MTELLLKKKKNTDGSITKSWRFEYVNEKGVRKFKQSKNKDFLKEQAEGIAKRITNVISKYPLWLDESNDKYCSKLYQKICSKTKSSSYLKNHKTFYKNYIQRKAPLDLRTIDEQFICDWLANLNVKSNVNNQTKRKIFNAFKNIYEVHVPGDIKTNVFKSQDYLKDFEIPKKKVHDINFDVWSNDKVQNIINNVADKQVKIMYNIMFQTACRPSEARALKKDDLRFLNNNPYIQISSAIGSKKEWKGTKTPAGVRRVYISNTLIDEIKAHVQTLPEHQDALFLNSEKKPVCLSVMTQQLNKALKKCNIDKLPVDRKTYFFRHFTASYWGYSKKYDNPLDFARDFGDKDINFIYENYIARYNPKDEDRYLDYLNKTY